MMEQGHWMEAPPIRLILRTQRSELCMRHFPVLAPTESSSHDRCAPHLRRHACRNFQTQKAFSRMESFLQAWSEMGQGSDALFGPKLNANHLKRGPRRQGHLCRAKVHLEQPPRCPLIAPNRRLRNIAFDSQQIAPLLVAGDEELQLFQRNRHHVTSSAKLADATKVSATATPFFCAVARRWNGSNKMLSGPGLRDTLESDRWP